MNINKILKYIIFGGVFLLPFIALCVWNDLYFPFITGKNFSFRIIIEIITLSWLILALRDHKYLPKFSWILCGASILVIIMAVADFFSANPFKSFWSNYERMEGLVTLLHLLAMLIVTGTMFTAEKMWNWLLHLCISSSLFLSIYALLQKSGELSIDQGGVRIDATLGNATYLAIYLVFNIFLIAFFFLSRTSSHARDSNGDSNGMLLSKKTASHAFIAGIIGFACFFIYYLWHLLIGKGAAHTAGVMLTILSVVGIILLSYLYTLNKKVALPPYLLRIVYGVFAIIELIVLYYTATRGAIIGTFIGFLFISISLALRGRKVSKNDLQHDSQHDSRGDSQRDLQPADQFAYKSGKYALIALVVVFLFFLGIHNTSFAQKSPVLSRFNSLVTLNFGSIASGEGKSRLLLWGSALKGVAERPILGWGQESFNYIFYKYYNPAMYAQETWFDRAHNVFFDWLTAGGILGFLAYLSLFTSLLYYLWSRKVNHSNMDSGTALNNASSANSSLQASPDFHLNFTEKIVLTGLLIAYFINNLFVFDNITSYILFFILLSLIHSLYARPFQPAKYAFFKKNEQALATYGIPVFVVVFCVCLYFFNIKGIAAAENLIQAISPQPGGVTANIQYFQNAFAWNSFGNAEIRERLGTLAVQAQPVNFDTVTKTNLYNLAVSEMKKQVDQTPNDVRYLTFLANILDTYGNYSQSIPYLQKAIALSPGKQVLLFELGTDYLNLNDPKDAEATFKIAYDADHSYQSAQVDYAISAIYAGDQKLADSLLLPLFGSDIVPDANFTKAYLASKQYDKALATVRAQIVNDPNNLNLYANLAAVYLAAGDKTNAIAVLRAIEKMNPSATAQAEAYIKQIQSGK
jgi:tetratricopeptide (TPR) repeat protein/O-antigen ligase